ncbi:hypothetical protein PBY51_000301 [Eleginops maclovinus]|nr:hypothetical protein PBY51_000301 [Eleginops maclovinus]
MEHKHIGFQSPGQDSQQRKNTPINTNSGAARLGIIHSVSSTGELEENTVNGYAWVNYPILILPREMCPSLGQHLDL